MYCAHCHDVVKLFPEKRTCRCGKSWGHYLPDNSTTVQTWPSLSIGIANPDFAQSRTAFGEDPRHFSPMLSMRCWINPASEPDVQFVAGVPLPEEAEEPDEPQERVQEPDEPEERAQEPDEPQERAEEPDEPEERAEGTEPAEPEARAKPAEATRPAEAASA